jgi:hypothetical protein
VYIFSKCDQYLGSPFVCVRDVRGLVSKTFRTAIKSFSIPIYGETNNNKMLYVPHVTTQKSYKEIESALVRLASCPWSFHYSDDEKYASVRWCKRLELYSRYVYKGRSRYMVQHHIYNLNTIRLSESDTGLQTNKNRYIIHIPIQFEFQFKGKFVYD